MKVVYIAGKYRGPTPWAVEQNIRAAEDVAAKVIQAGHMPLCPHANTRHMEGLADDAFFLAGTMELLRRCDAVLCVGNWRDSVGARAEVEEARRLGLPVFGVGHEFADHLGRVGEALYGDDGQGKSFAMTMDAAIENLCEWATYDDKAERKWAPETAAIVKRKCNLHDDCDESDRKAKEAGKRIPHHCSVDDCEDCFGT